MIKVKKGDIVLVHSNGILAKAIHLGMRLKYWFSLDFNDRKIQNHGAIGVGRNAILEAIGRGVVLHNVNKAYKDKKNTIISVYSFNWDEEALEILDTMKDKLKGKKYQYSNFLTWAVNIFTFGKVWLGKKEADSMERQYCHETVGTCVYFMTQNPKYPLEYAAQKFFKKFWKTSPNKTEKFCRKYGTLTGEYYIGWDK